MLLTPKEPTPNPYAPFVYALGEIRCVGDLGDRFDADVWETRGGWRWSARYASPDVGDDLRTAAIAPESAPVPTEVEAVTAAATWLRRFLPSRVGG